MHKNLAFSTVHQVLGAGPDIYAVDVLPGFTLQEVANGIDGVPGPAGRPSSPWPTAGPCPPPTSPRAPPTWRACSGRAHLVLPGETDRQLLTTMVDRFDRLAQTVGLTPASAAALGLTPYQVVIAASIVQKEGYYVKNMAPVARVIYNRLAQRIPLQMNSTVLYSLGQDGGVVTPADLKPTPPTTATCTPA